MEKVRATKRFSYLPGPVDERFSVKFEICLVDEHSRLRRSVRNLHQNIAPRPTAPVGLFGLATAISRVAGADLRKQFAQWGMQNCLRAALDDPRAFGQSEDRVHGKGGYDDQRFVARIKIRGAQQMNRFVDSICEQDLRRIESEKTGNYLFDGLALGITRQAVGIERPQLCQHARRTPHRALIEIEAESSSAGQRRAIGVQFLYRVARFKHGSTSLGTLLRVLSGPQPWPG